MKIQTLQVIKRGFGIQSILYRTIEEDVLFQASVSVQTTANKIQQRFQSNTQGRLAFAASLYQEQQLIRNIGISAHIDSGKTTLTERFLYYTGRIKDMHEVGGKDGVGAVMDSMDIERERGITIKSAATYCRWIDTNINLIDTPGHVDFTIEVERAMRVLDGAVLVLCGVGGVQSQTLTVDRQMKRYNVPRIAFINKLDRIEANPYRVLKDMRAKLKDNFALVCIPIGIEQNLEGVIDVIKRKAYYFSGVKGFDVNIKDIPADYQKRAEEIRRELIEKVADVDDQLADKFIAEEEIGNQELAEAVRRATIARKFTPVLSGSAFKNKGVQPVLDAVRDFLPHPDEIKNQAFSLDKSNEMFVLPCSSQGPLVAYAFKLEDGRAGQLTYMRLYSGILKKGMLMYNVNSKQKAKCSRLVRVHSNEIQEVEEAGAGEIVGVVGVKCSSGDTFTEGKKIAMTNILVPEPVVSLSINLGSSKNVEKLNQALNRFEREDPTFTVNVNEDSGETIINGMGELHLEIYLERLRREYDIQVLSGKPRVNFKETILASGQFEYTYKRQTGGHGQYAQVTAQVEPLGVGKGGFEFQNEVKDNSISASFIQACRKGFLEAMNTGLISDNKITGVRFILESGKMHAIDSSDVAFKVACILGFREVYQSLQPSILEPIMKLEVNIPQEYSTGVAQLMEGNRCIITDQKTIQDTLIFVCEAPLNDMFGFATSLRKATSGKGEFSMEYLKHELAPDYLVAEVMENYVPPMVKLP